MTANSQHKIKIRLLAVITLVTFVFCILLGRLFYVIVIDGKELQAKALDQWTRDVPTVAPRGKITDINGVIFADSLTEYTVFVRPTSVKDKEHTAYVLSRVLDVDYEKLLAKMQKKGVSEVTVAKKVSKEKVLEIESDVVTGVYYSMGVQRYYPYGDFMTQLLGFTNVDTVGQSGLESYYDKYLRGVNGYQLTETDLIGRELDGKIKYIPPIDGMNVRLTVDYYIQSLVEKAVRDAMVRYNAKGATCIIMNPKTGGIYGLAQAPSFDLNNVPREDIGGLFDMMKCTSISNVYEPGSTFKILTSAIGLETGKFNANYKFHCNGSRTVDGKKIKCWRTIGHGSQNFAEGINNSCNCLFMDIALACGTSTMYDYFRKFGLNTTTGIDMVGEGKGLLINEKSVKNVDLARMGFGQAIAVTPIELISAVSCVINGGTKITPYVMDSVYDKDGKLALQNTPKSGSRLISDKTSADMRTFLRGVVDVGGGKNAQVKGYSIGGKTGTAQKYENGAIAQGKYVSSFIGFTSVDDPEYVCLMIVDEPKGYVYYGSIVAAPYVADIFKNIFEYKKMQPTEKTGGIEYTTMPYLIGMTASEAAKILKGMNIQFELAGDGVITNQLPMPNALINQNTIAFIGCE